MVEAEEKVVGEGGVVVGEEEEEAMGGEEWEQEMVERVTMTV